MSAASSVDWRSRERSNLPALRLMVWIALKLGRPTARLLLHPVALYFLLFAPTARRHSLRYLSRALNRRAGWRDAYRHFHAFACVVLDRIWFVRDEIGAFDIRMSGHDGLLRLLAEGRGAFLVGAHLGSFEALHAVGGTGPNQPRIAMVMYPDNARMLHQVLAAIAPGFELGIIQIGKPGSTLAIRDWLDGGGLAGLLADRYMPDAAARGGVVQAPFLGRDTVFGDGPMRLALLLKRRVVFMVGLYLGGNRYELRFHELADFRAPPADAPARERLVTTAVAAYAAQLEALCRERPYNWFNFHDYWHEDAA